MHVLGYELTKEDRIDAIKRYKNGEELCMWLPLPWHTNLDVLVSSRMGYYSTTGRFMRIREHSQMSMIRTFLNLIDYKFKSSGATIYLDDFLSNLSVRLLKDTEPYVNNKHKPETFRLIHICNHIYADPVTFEFVRSYDNRRASIFKGIFKCFDTDVYYSASPLDWLDAVDPDMFILGDKVSSIREYLRKKFGRIVAYRKDGFNIHVSNGDVLQLTSSGRFKDETKEIT